MREIDYIRLRNKTMIDCALKVLHGLIPMSGKDSLAEEKSVEAVNLLYEAAEDLNKRIPEIK